MIDTCMSEGGCGHVIRMADNISPAERSKVMARVRQRNTGPEMVVRRMLHALGYRFRLHQAELPGVPDVVFVKRRKIIFVHGCFWHGHTAATCKLARVPKSRTEFWRAKVRYNQERFEGQLARLKAMHWDVAVVWECELKEPEDVKRRLGAFLGS